LFLRFRRMSSENECIKLRPSPVCGYKGTCLNETTCVCESGWGRSTEMALYLKGDSSTISDANLVCDICRCIVGLV